MDLTTISTQELLREFARRESAQNAAAVVQLCENALAAGEDILIDGKPYPPQRLKELLTGMGA